MPSADIRRFTAGMRAIAALLSALTIYSVDGQVGMPGLIILVGYTIWSGYLLWSEAACRGRVHLLLCYWIDVAWTCAAMQIASSGTLMLVLTLVQPIVLATIGYGVFHGVLLALLGAAGVMVYRGLEPSAGALGQWVHAAPSLGVLVLALAAALLSRPMSVLRQRVALVSQLDAHLDPRRGLEAISGAMATQLRSDTEAKVVALVLPSVGNMPAMLDTVEEGSFRASLEAQQRFESLLGDVPAHGVTHVRKRCFGLLGGTRCHGEHPPPAGTALKRRLDELAELLDVGALTVMPIMRYEKRHGHLLLGHAARHGRAQDVAALSEAMPELTRMIEQATLVDQLQDESAGHERARIGRDLHDSAIQPYLGLKYAVECVALRIPADNPARGEVDALAELVNGEVSALRELISGLRSGEAQGDNALVPAVRRQVRRFSLLFGIDVHLECPESLPTSRALAGSLFHMVNEALNNVRKHTQAQHIWIRLASEADGVRLAVRDDAGSIAGRPTPDFRPRSLSERAAELGGALSICRPDNLNTEVAILVPQR